MQALCQLDIQGEDGLGTLAGFFNENADDAIVAQLADEWARKTWDNLCRCDELIQSATLRWQVSRLCQVDRSILRLGTYQLEFCPDIPSKVIINEAIELAKKFSSETAPGFVNGVLDAVSRKIEQQKKEKCER